MAYRTPQLPAPVQERVDAEVRAYRDCLRAIVREAQESALLDVDSGQSITERQRMREINAEREPRHKAALTEIERLATAGLGVRP